jgi:hypothetical protein
MALFPSPRPSRKGREASRAVIPMTYDLSADKCASCGFNICGTVVVEVVALILVLLP